jgi:PTH1 family peptidyl-tRNA hydrolase
LFPTGSVPGLRASIAGKTFPLTRRQSVTRPVSASPQPLVIIGLGNPGPQHAGDRHNVGFWLVDQLAAQHGGRFAAQRRLLAEECAIQLGGQSLRLFKPTTFMNRSGQCVRAVMDFYKVPVESLLLVHDELDLPVGTVRLKRGGGHGGHNGLRDAVAHCGADFLRLRVGIGHPGHKSQVVDYVLHAPGKAERLLILDGLDAAAGAIETLARSGLDKAMQQLHTAAPTPADLGPAG